MLTNDERRELVDWARSRQFHSDYSGRISGMVIDAVLCLSDAERERDLAEKRLAIAMEALKATIDDGYIGGNSWKDAAQEALAAIEACK